MIIIVDFKGNNSILCDFLNENNIDFKFSSIESDLLQASKIILPDIENIQKAVKRLQISNLFSVLRITKKPILGINNGFFLMCNQVINFNKCGLGLFEFSDVDFTNLEGDKFDEGLLQISDNSKLLHSDSNDKKVYFNYNHQLLYNDFTRSSIILNEKRFSLICEYKNYYGIQIFLDHTKNLEIFNEVLSNFINL